MISQPHARRARSLLDGSNGRSRSPVYLEDVLALNGIADLVERAKRKEADASALLVRKYLRPAYAVALAVVRRPADAEDVAQDAFVVAFERLDSCRHPERFAGWLLQIVRNRALNFVEHRRLRDVPREEVSDESGRLGVEMPQTENIGLRKVLLEALSKLSQTQREVVLLHDLEGWTHAEVASALEMSEVMSRQHLFMARRLLRGLLSKERIEEVEHGR